MSSTPDRARNERLLWALPIVVSLLFCLPALFTDHYNDDWTLRFIADGRATTYDANPARLFEFTRSPAHTAQLIDGGWLPWWSSPSLRLRFFRPFSSLLFAGEQRLFGDGPLVGHAHSVLWFALTLVLTARLFRATLSPRMARIALWIAALAPHMVNGAMWPSARSGVSAAAAALGALVLHAEARAQHRAVPTLWIALLFVVGLGFGELALGLVPLSLAIEWALNERARWRERLVTVAPVFVIGHAYLALYVLLGYGAGGSALYLDPAKELGVALRELPLRLGILLLDGLYAVPSELYLFLSSGRVAIAVVSIASLLALLTWLHRTRDERDSRDHRVVMALLLGSLFAVAPGLFGIPGGRLLSVGFVGFAVALAALWDRALSLRASRPVVARATIVALVVVRVALASLFRVGFTASIVMTARAERRIATEHRFQCPARSAYVLLDGADPPLGMYAGPSLVFANHGMSGSFQTLSMQTDALLVERTSERAIMLSPLHGGTLTDFIFADVFRSPREPFIAGQTLRLQSMTVRVIAVRDGRPQRVEFTFNSPFAPIEGGATCLVYWHQGRLQSFTPPPVGASVELAHEPGPSGV